MTITSFKQVKHIYIIQAKYLHQNHFKALELSYEPVNTGQKKVCKVYLQFVLIFWTKGIGMKNIHPSLFKRSMHFAFPIACFNSSCFRYLKGRAMQRLQPRISVTRLRILMLPSAKSYHELIMFIQLFFHQGASKYKRRTDPCN